MECVLSFGWLLRYNIVNRNCICVQLRAGSSDPAEDLRKIFHVAIN